MPSIVLVSHASHHALYSPSIAGLPCNAYALRADDAAAVCAGSGETTTAEQQTLNCKAAKAPEVAAACFAYGVTASSPQECRRPTPLMVSAAKALDDPVPDLLTKHMCF